MAEYGLLIDYDWCSGCHSCEMACQMEHGLAVGQYGIKVFEVGPWQISGATWQYSYVPIPTKQCDLCSGRQKLGKPPSCVQHCQAQCMSYGSLAELSVKLSEKPTQVLFSVQ
jgi:anaerobic dimethyl sulfoxide reductase subunit B (iron-sulfur subunit)